MSHIRHCSRRNCQEPAVATMTYSYRDATTVVGPLAPVPQPGAFDLCADHALSVTVPMGWQLVRLITEFEPVEPSTDDLTALADAIRAASKKDVPPPQPARREVARPAVDLNRAPRPRPKFTVVEGGAAESQQPREDTTASDQSALRAIEDSQDQRS
ncbi:DUF3499 domain-containing protein [Arcanobacterium bovis]|uniref:DUF3499 domain-containing protein n=1 Tax=Arcanobacterium bovis TaxID=2529275 RepID=A0A4V2KRA1_9ACTO|nr:DUF3499 domain-containing protein [Arcanobacterium bovis]TBW23624.1 DUF3499 domain-containing protein [Arcanobacterium bovis]